MTGVAIVGAGPVGLTCALLLSRQGISTIVHEQNEATFTHPARRIGARGISGDRAAAMPEAALMPSGPDRYVALKANDAAAGVFRGEGIA